MNLDKKIEMVQIAADQYHNDWIGSILAVPIFTEAYGPISAWPFENKTGTQFMVEDVQRAIRKIRIRRKLAIEQAQELDRRMKEEEAKEEDVTEAIGSVGSVTDGSAGSVTDEPVIPNANDVTGRNNMKVSKLAAQLGVKHELVIAKCQESGLPHIGHYNNIVWPDEIELIRGWFPEEVSVAT